MLSRLPSTRTLRCAAFRRKGAEILTVLLVVVLLEHMFVFPFETVQFELGGLAFCQASHPGESSLWRIENGRRPGRSWEGRPFFIAGGYSVVGSVQIRDCIGLQSQTYAVQTGVSARALDREGRIDFVLVVVLLSFAWDQGMEWAESCSGWNEFGRMFSLGMAWQGGWDTTGEAQREPGFL
jgi:hypothetical protein